MVSSIKKRLCLCIFAVFVCVSGQPVVARARKEGRCCTLRTTLSRIHRLHVVAKSCLPRFAEHNEFRAPSGAGAQKE
jgi:hypothetical protein